MPEASPKGITKSVIAQASPSRKVCVVNAAGVPVPLATLNIWLSSIAGKSNA
jgi:hypothetical protein